MDRHSVETTVLLFVAEYCVLWRGTLSDGLHIWGCCILHHHICDKEAEKNP